MAGSLPWARPIDPASAEEAAWEREVRRRGGDAVQVGWVQHEDITETLAERGVEIRPYRVDVGAFREFVERAGYGKRRYFDGGRRAFATEKYLEHFVSADLIAPRRGEVLVDVASSASPFPDVVRERFGCRTYRQDLAYGRGLRRFRHVLRRDRIPGDACQLPLPPSSVDALSLHCSFEHFEGDRDGRFVREAARVLRPGGRLCIVPLYTCRAYCIQTDPRAWAADAPAFDAEARVSIAERWGEGHGRFYDADRFLSRVVANAGDFDLRVFRIENFAEAGTDCYLRFAALFTRRG